MAKKQALRELQGRLAERLQAARSQPLGRSWLAVECAGRGLLFPLAEAGEIFAPAPLLPVPHTQAWFLGVANLRGHLHGVVDLAGFLGLAPVAPAATAREGTQFVVFNLALGLNCALQVDRLAGLRHEDQLDRAEDDSADRPAFARARYRDADGRIWQELSLAALAAHPSFLRVVG